MNTLKLVTFDATGTILGLKQSVGLQYFNVASKYGVKVSPDKLSVNFKNTFNKLLEEHPNFGESSIGWKLWWKELVFRVFSVAIENKSYMKPELINQISADLIELYKTNECWKVMDGAQDLLEKLHNKKKRLGVLSNYDPRLFDILKHLKVESYFDFIVTSYSVKCAKPSLGIFMAVERMNLNIKKNEILHIGDNPRLDYIGAKQAGWNALLISNEPKQILERYPNIDQSCIVENLSQVYNVLSLKKLL